MINDEFDEFDDDMKIKIMLRTGITHFNTLFGKSGGF